jgi:hypothetical protein
MEDNYLCYEAYSLTLRDVQETLGCLKNKLEVYEYDVTNEILALIAGAKKDRAFLDAALLDIFERNCVKRYRQLGGTGQYETPARLPPGSFNMAIDHYLDSFAR